MTLESGTAAYRGSAPKNSPDESVRRSRARNRAYSRLANLHPHEWTELYTAALAEEGLPPNTKV